MKPYAYIAIALLVSACQRAGPESHDETSPPLAVFQATFHTGLYETDLTHDWPTLQDMEYRDAVRFVRGELEAEVVAGRVVRSRRHGDSPLFRMTIEKDSVYYEMDVEVTAPFTFAVTAFESLPPGIVKSLDEAVACSEPPSPMPGWLPEGDTLNVEVWRHATESCRTFTLVATMLPDDGSRTRTEEERIQFARNVARMNHADAIAIGSEVRPPDLGPAFSIALSPGTIAMIRYTDSLSSNSVLPR